MDAGCAEEWFDILGGEPEARFRKEGKQIDGVIRVSERKEGEMAKWEMVRRMGGESWKTSGYKWFRVIQGNLSVW